MVVPFHLRADAPPLARPIEVDHEVAAEVIPPGDVKSKVQRLLEKGVSPDVIARQLRVGFNRNQFFAQLQRMPLPRIAVLLEELATIDYATKTGQAQAPVAIEQLVLKLTVSSGSTRLWGGA